MGDHHDHTNYIYDLVQGYTGAVSGTPILDTDTP
jgi:hypothetical protein